MTGRSRPPKQPPLRPQPPDQHRVRPCTRFSAVLVFKEDVDGGGAAVHVRVPAPSHVFHEADVAGAKHMAGQGDRIFIPSIDVEERLESDRIVGPWVVDQDSTLLLWLEI